MIILDTNVVSEPWRPRPDAGVVDWLGAQPAATLFLCTPVLAELRFGAELLAAGRRKIHLLHAIDQLESRGYPGRILALDSMAANAFGRLAARRERLGRRMQPMDALIAAIALTHGAALATRDIDDFAGLGIEVINPFEL
jgi:hypothetical protein